MKCESLLDHYFTLDKHEALPMRVKIHLFHCGTCKKVIERMSAAEAVQQQILNMPLDNSNRMLNKTMQNIYRLHGQHTQSSQIHNEKPALLSWLIAGIVLMLGFIVVPFSDIGKAGLQQFGHLFSISFALLCASSVVAYSAIFIAKNIMFFTEKFDI